jgi:hypothetical protein
MPTLPIGTSRHARKTSRHASIVICCQEARDRPRPRDRPIYSSSQFSLIAQPHRANNLLSGRRRSSQMPIGFGLQHAASFNPASNRSRAELAARSVRRDLFEPSSIPTEVGHPFRFEAGHRGEPRLKLSMSAIESRRRPPFAAMQGEVRCLARECQCGSFAKF